MSPSSFQVPDVDEVLVMNAMSGATGLYLHAVKQQAANYRSCLEIARLINADSREEGYPYHADEVKEWLAHAQAAECALRRVVHRARMARLTEFAVA